MKAASDASAPSDRELLITRVFDAPRELVWKAWTDPHLATAAARKPPSRAFFAR